MMLKQRVLIVSWRGTPSLAFPTVLSTPMYEVDVNVEGALGWRELSDGGTFTKVVMACEIGSQEGVARRRRRLWPLLP